jgi:hypothetical protein
MPLSFSENFKGDTLSNDGGSEGLTIYKIGLTAKVYARRQFDLAYTGYYQKIEAVSGSTFGSRPLGAPYKTKGMEAS